MIALQDVAAAPHPAATGGTPALAVEDLSIVFDTAKGPVSAVDGISFTLARGEVLGLVGESGSGKTITGLALLGLLPHPGRVARGSIRLDGVELVGMPEREFRRLRGQAISIVFQNPMNSLNPLLRIGAQLVETIGVHEKLSEAAAYDRAATALTAVGIPSARERLAAYPHQLSGGMRQRVVIAMALLHRPAVLVADEPTTALDVTIQAQILSEVQALAEETGTALLWITHDLAVVSALADRILVMYSGRRVEIGAASNVLMNPLHPYTAGLLSSIPSRNRRGDRLAQIPGMMPALGARPPGCEFAPRCAYAQARCRTDVPPDDRRADRAARCFFPLDGGADR